MQKPRSSSILAAFLFLAAVALLLFWQVHRLATAQNWVDHTDQVIAQVYLLGDQVAHSEGGMHGYVTTGNNEFLEQYQIVINHFLPGIQTLRQLTIDNPSQTKRIDALLQTLGQWIAYCHSLITLKRSGKEVDSLIRTLEGKHILDTVHTQFSEILSEERQLRYNRIATITRETRNTSLAAILSFILIGTLLTRSLLLQRSWEKSLQETEAKYRTIIENTKDYAIFMLDPQGNVLTWNKGAALVIGYEANEIIGQHFSTFYPLKDIQAGKPDMELRIITTEGRYETEGWRLRKDGSQFWANSVFTALREPKGRLLGFSTIVRDLTERKRFESELQSKNAALIAANKELEAFSYSVSHDLRAPLRSADGFSKVLLEDYGEQLDDQAKDYLHRIRASSQRMAQLIDDLLNLSRLTRKEMTLGRVDLSDLVKKGADELQKNEPQRNVKFIVQNGIIVKGDHDLLRVLVENLLSNAWKFTSKHASSTIEFGVISQNKKQVYFVRDDGAGFDMSYIQKLFGAFQRLHRATEFPGTGVGLATVQRIVHRHSGLIWADSQIEKGTTFYFTIEAEISKIPKTNELLKEAA